MWWQILKLTSRRLFSLFLSTFLRWLIWNLFSLFVKIAFLRFPVLVSVFDHKNKLSRQFLQQLIFFVKLMDYTLFHVLYPSKLFSWNFIWVQFISHLNSNWNLFSCSEFRFIKLNYHFSERALKITYTLFSWNMPSMLRKNIRGHFDQDRVVLYNAALLSDDCLWPLLDMLFWNSWWVDSNSWVSPWSVMHV